MFHKSISKYICWCTPPQIVLLALCHLHIVLLIYQDKKGDVPKDLTFAKNSDNFCVTSHSRYMQTRHLLPTSGTINKNEKKTSFPASCRKADTLSKALDFSDSLESSSTNSAPSPSRTGSSHLCAGGSQTWCPGCWTPTLVFSTYTSAPLLLKPAQYLPNLGLPNMLILSAWNSIFSNWWKLHFWSSFLCKWNVTFSGETSLNHPDGITCHLESLGCMQQNTQLKVSLTMKIHFPHCYFLTIILQACSSGLSRGFKVTLEPGVSFLPFSWIFPRDHKMTTTAPSILFSQNI